MRVCSYRGVYGQKKKKQRTSNRAAGRGLESMLASGWRRFFFIRSPRSERAANTIVSATALEAKD
jgi:hypothetical protein